MARKRKKKQAKRRQSLAQRIDWPMIGASLLPLAKLAVVGAIGIGLFRSYQWVMLPTTFPLTHVQVTSTLQRVDAAQVRDTLKQQAGGGFFSADLESLARELEQVPWVNRVSMRRVWPDSLLIAVEEEAVIANWGKDAYLNRYGEAFSVPNLQPDPGLPTIVGSKGREKALISAFNRADETLHPLGLRLIELQEDARGDQRLLLDNGVEIALGRVDQAVRLERFKLAYEKTLEPVMGRVAGLDLRYSNGFSVRWNRDQESHFTKTANSGI